MTRHLSVALCVFAAIALPAQRARLVQPPAPQAPATTEKPPYTATIVTTVDQTLADGNTIHQEQTATQARDSQGRTRSEHQIGIAGSAAAKTVINVTDPVNKTVISWVVGSGVANVHSMNHATSTTGAGRGTVTVEVSGSTGEPAVRSHDDVKTENLGTREIEGIQATGRRTTRTIAAGEEGNAEPIVSTREIWQSRTLNLVMLSISESPKDGKRVAQVTELQQSEPDAALFQPPADYTVKDDQ
jgi:hypothetical protein